jgi:deazaflavin-dependent oxidoreductase (nitroreductase family)
MAKDRPGPVLRRLLAAPLWLYRARLGWLLGRRFLMLTHVGRRSGRTYRTVVEVVARPDGEYVAVAGFGPTTDWLRNVEAGGGREVAVGRQTFRPAVRRLDVDEAARVLADYERRNRLAAPVVRAVLSRLVGWRYTGTDEERRRLVTERPLVAFRPADG